MGAYELQTSNLIVTSAADRLDMVFNPSDLTLRDALAEANAHTGVDTITFAQSLAGATITLTLGELTITDAVIIDGPGASKLTIDAAGQSRIFNVNDGNDATAIDVRIDGLKLIGGNAAGDGGAILSAENLTVLDSLVTGNTASGSGGGISMGTLGSGSLVVQNSTIAGNIATTGQGGGIDANNDGSLTILNSTITGNQATAGQGGGIWTKLAAGSTVTVQSSTIAGNSSALSGGGLYAANGSGTLAVESTIIAGNTDASATAPDVFGIGPTNLAHSLVGDNTGSGLTEAPIGAPDASGNLIGGPTNGIIDPGLGSLADNGGAVPTMALLTGSPAIDTGSNPAGLATDARGAPYARVAGAAADMGAYEVQTALMVTSAEDRLDATFDPADLTLRDAIAIANGLAGADTIVFAPSLDGKIITLSLGELAITDSVTIQGPGATNLTIDGDNLSRIFNVDDGNANTNIDVQIQGLTLTDGNAGINAGGAIYSTENLTVLDCTITGSHANGAGGIYANTTGSGHTLIQNSIFAGDTSLGGGGINAVTADNATTTIENCVFFVNGANSGGGILTSTSDNGTAIIEDSTFLGNSSGGGGAIDTLSSAGTTIIQRDTICASNSTGIVVAGTFSTGTTIIQDSTIFANNASSNGGGIFCSFFVFSGAVTIQNSTISGNTASGGGGIYSGDPARERSPLRVRSSPAISSAPATCRTFPFPPQPP